MSIETLEIKDYSAVSWEFLLPGKGREKRAYPASFLGAVIFHIAFLFFGSTFFITAPQYGVDLGKGGLEVQLIAASAEMNAEEKKSDLPVQNSLPAPADSQAEMTLPTSSQTGSESRLQDEKRLSGKKPAVKGDGSAPIAGTDATTLYSAGGAMMEGTEGYLRNPAPFYPQASIDLRQEGLVVINVLVGRTGRVEKIELKESSGHSLLDKSALKALKKWKFDPARVGFLAHEAWVTIPVRFRLEEKS